MPAIESKPIGSSRYAALNTMDTQTPSPTTSSAPSQTPSTTTNFTSMTDDTTLVNTITHSSTAFSSENIYLPDTHYRFSPQSFLPGLLTELNLTQQRIYSAALRRQHAAEADVDMKALYAVAKQQRHALMREIRLEAFRAGVALKVRRAIANRDASERTCFPAGLRGLEYQVAKLVLKYRVRKAEMEVEDLWECVKGGVYLFNDAEKTNYYWG